MEKVDFKNLMDQYKVEIDTWHLFYETFIEYDNAISIARGVLVSMMSEVIKAKKINPSNEKIKYSEDRINILFASIEKLNGLNTKCNNLQINLKKTVFNQLKIEEENTNLKAEIAALKASFND